MKLEHFIRKNRNSFDDCEPENEHFKRFENKLYKNKPSRNYFKVYITAASITAISLLTTIMLYIMPMRTNSPNGENNTTQHNLADEYLETENYYNRIIKNKIEVLKNIQCQNKNFQISDFMAEVKEFDKIDAALKKELEKSGKNERIISAIIETHRKKIEILDRMIQITKQHC